MNTGTATHRTRAASLLHAAALAGVALLAPAGTAATAAAPRASAQPPAAGNPHGAYQEDCSLCHGDEGWRPARVSPKFRHAPARFPLEGAHAQTGCRSCHKTLDFAAGRPAADCVSCHQDPHQGELGADCVRCHSTRSFIDHARMQRAHQTTRFPLAGAHLSASCEQCHGVPSSGHLSYVNLGSGCDSCHLTEYLATTNPSHGAAGFPTDCRMCHGTVAWIPTDSFNFDHAATGFPLTGAHRSQRCGACHQGGVFTGLSPDCVTCHQQDYDRTTDPAHGAAGFPTDCAGCHATSAWTPATFDHDALYFPIYSGAHRGRWSGCDTCHVNSGNYAQFSCWGGCHEHADPARVGNQHDNVAGYVYDSQACYGCHPRGNH